MIVSYRYRIKDRSARKTLARHAYAVNQVWNWCCGYQRDIEAHYRAGAPKRQWPSHFDLARLCKGVGADLGIHQQTVQAVCRDFANARDAGHHAPRFRSSFSAQRARGWVPFQQQTRRVSGNAITYLGKRYRFWEGGRPLPANAKGGCFVEDAQGRWYVCFQAEVDARRCDGSAEIGIDLGLKSLAALSDGRAVATPQLYRRHEARLAVAQRAGNKRRVRALHAKIKNCRTDFLHKLSTELARSNSFIAVGNVNSSRLAKTKMSKSVLDAGWSTFRTMLAYKAAKYVEVDERFTTVTCSACNERSGPQGHKGLRVRQWECSVCGVSHDRDVNSALNILAIARRGAAPPVEGSRRIAA